MNYLWLEDFVALATHGGFSRAAEARHVTQPAFSRRIRALEDWLGVELVDRSRQPIVPTAAGIWFAGIARSTLARVERMPDEARAIAEAGAATIRIAATHALSLTFLPPWLRGYEGRVLTAPVELISDVLERCEDAMIDERVQFLLCHAHPEVKTRLDGRFPFASIGRDVLMPVCASDGQRASSRPKFGLTGPSGKPVPLLAYSSGSGMGRLVASLRAVRLERAGATTILTAHLATVLKSMALDGRGIAWLPRSLIEDDLRARRLVAAAPPSWWIDVEIRLYRSDASLAPTAEAFWAAVTGT
jgi:LysR family transcriptional regulator, hypochlorite-specific transcription factor HypT